MFDDPSITVFDETCLPVWRQEVPDLGEIGFRILDVPGGTSMLMVVSKSEFMPADDEIYVFELLLPVLGTMTSITPTFLEADRGTSTYIGSLGKDQSLVVVSGTNKFGWNQKVSEHRTRALLYRWQKLPGFDRGPVYAFCGPEILDEKELEDLHVPGSTALPPFPLSSFVSPP